MWQLLLNKFYFTLDLHYTSSHVLDMMYAENGGWVTWRKISIVQKVPGTLKVGVFGRTDYCGRYLVPKMVGVCPKI